MSEYIHLITPKDPRFSKTQLQTLIDICINIGTISAGSVVIPALIGNFSLLALAIGLTLVVIFWLVAVIIARKIDHE